MSSRALFPFHFSVLAYMLATLFDVQSPSLRLLLVPFLALQVYVTIPCVKAVLSEVRQ